MLRFLQKRKFRLVTRWKSALKDNIGFQLPSQQHFPYALIFRAFDEVVRLLKSDSSNDRIDLHESLLSEFPGEDCPSADQYMELFLTGRDVLGEFVESDPAFCSLHSTIERQALRSAMEKAFKQLIDREMREHARRHSSFMPG
ncbi:hypothetical protein ASA1KI_26820 [Opitutales bacterium ASA1]|jgi:hypothetical protein|nr:hypothetical protein ASA1KI_26820 [Opitutales bacterium ASA1]